MDSVHRKFSIHRIFVIHRKIYTILNYGDDDDEFKRSQENLKKEGFFRFFQL